MYILILSVIYLILRLRCMEFHVTFLLDKPIFCQVMDEFIEFVGEDPIIAHNAEFDLKFINEELRRAGRRLKKTLS